nr:MAG TPA: hypothetical protein [Caudoviricetes sp.]
MLALRILRQSPELDLFGLYLISNDIPLFRIINPTLLS